MLTPQKKRYRFSPELAAQIESQMVQGRVASSDATKVNNNTSTTVEVKRKQKRANQRIANQHASKVVSERDANRRAQKLNIDRNKDNGQDVGTITDAHQAKIDKAFSDYGLSNALGQMTNVSDKWRATPSFGRFIGKDVPMSMATVGTFTAAPQTALFGLGTSYIGSKIGGNIGENFGNREAGQIIGSLAGPIAASGFNRAILPTVKRTFANEFGTSYGYNQLARVPYFTKTLAKGGAKEYPKVTTNPETGDQMLSIIERSARKTTDNPSSVARAQATSKYAGMPDSETPFYLQNQNGSYRYNIDESPYSTFGLFKEFHGELPIKQAARKGSDVHGDFIGNNGGNVQIRYDGQFTHNGDTYNRYMMRDVWDLQPYQQLVSKGGEWLGDKIFSTSTNLGGKLMDKAITHFGENTGTKIGNSLFKASDALEKGVRNTAKKMAESKTLNTLFNREVGRIVGAKPFTLEHPFAVKASVLEKPGPGSINYRLRGNSLNLFSNEKVPGARFSTPYELGLDMPFDFTRTQKNLVYPIFNYENLNKQ